MSENHEWLVSALLLLICLLLLNMILAFSALLLLSGYSILLNLSSIESLKNRRCNHVHMLFSTLFYLFIRQSFEFSLLIQAVPKPCFKPFPALGGMRLDFHFSYPPPSSFLSFPSSALVILVSSTTRAKTRVCTISASNKFG
jgi:hypothetical protein